MLTELNRFVRLYYVPILAIVVIVIAGIVIGVARGAPLVGSPRKEKLPRDDVYYEINNDVDDHGNFIETYHLPNGRGGKVYCVVYSDKIGDGGGAGMSCDWEHSR